jgi:thiol-disulfide isomerase/thioredoxin
MKNLSLILILAFVFSTTVKAQRVDTFTLPDVISEANFDLSDHQSSKAIVLIFTSLSCPFSKLYEDRILELEKAYGGDGFVFVLVHPQVGQEDESIVAIRQKVKEKGWQMPFLNDSGQKLSRQLSITKLPESVVILPSPTGFSIVYRGAIDNNPQIAANANIKYLENALQAINNRRNPSPATSRPIGCNLRTGF